MTRIDLPVLTTSERSCARRCPQKWYWKYRMGLTPKGEAADALWFGQGVHIALAEWYQKGKRRGPHPADTFEKWCVDEVRDIHAAYAQGDREFDDAKYEDAHDLGVAMLEGYVEEYDRDSQWHILAIETPFKTRVIRAGKPVALFMSAWDGVYRDLSDGSIWLLENKTAAQINTAYLALDDQGGSYWAVASAVLRARGILAPGETIAGIMYNFLRKSKPDLRPRNAEGAYLNKDGTISKKQSPPRFVREPMERSPQELVAQMNRLSDEVAIMNGMRSGAIPITKNTTKDCTWCEFFNPCQLHERGGEAYKELIKAHFQAGNPYERYIKSAGNE